MGMILGIDQGSSHTRAVVCSVDGHVLGYGTSRGACHIFDGMQTAMQAANASAQTALRQAGLQNADVGLIYAGFTGVDWPDEYALLENNVRELGICERVIMTNDSMIALRGGTQRPYGAILIAGSGGNCGVRAPDGREFIYHYYHDDELQGGGALGAQAIQAVYRSHTGRIPPTTLTGRILDFFKVHSVDDLLRGRVEGRLPVNNDKALAPMIFEEAYRGDRAAVEILMRFGEGCAGLVTNALGRFDMLNLELDVVLSGSIFKGLGPLLVDTLTTHVHREAPRAHLVNAHYEPVLGAAMLGLEELGIPIRDEVIINLERTAIDFGLIRM